MTRNYKNPYSEHVAQDKPLAEASVARAALSDCIGLLSDEQRLTFDSNGGGDAVLKYVEGEISSQWIARQRRMLFHHIQDWRSARGIAPNVPENATRLDRLLNWLVRGRAAKQANWETWAFADRLLLTVIHIQLCVFAGTLRVTAAKR